MVRGRGERRNKSSDHVGTITLKRVCGLVIYSQTGTISVPIFMLTDFSFEDESSVSMVCVPALMVFQV